MLQTWKNVLFRPGEEVFENEKVSPNATLGTAILWMLIAAVISAVLAYLASMLWSNAVGGYDQILEQLDLPPEITAEFQTIIDSGMLDTLMGVGGVLSLIFIPLGFLISTGLRHLVAKILKGKGTFGNYAYLNAAIEAPIKIISAIVSFAPGIGTCISLLLSVYMYVQRYHATKVAYQLSSGKAIAVVLIPILLLFALGACGVIAFGILMRAYLEMPF